MPIHPLPVFEADLRAAQEEQRSRSEGPRTLVVRFGLMKMIGEFPYDGPERPGCGSRLVVRTFRGTELGEMLTSTCPNAGCSKSITRRQMLDYIERSGGKDYPFFTEGRVLRVATREDLEVQGRLDESRRSLRDRGRVVASRLGAAVKIVEVEPILGQERLTVFVSTEQRVEFRDLARELGQEFQVRVDVRQVGARDEARLIADYERCGQYCCCKNFLKVLRPVSMKSAKVQKATLDPLKISGRCGRLMCCLRYEDVTYEELRKRLPARRSRVGTPQGDGVVLDTQILTQLVLVQVDGRDSPIAVPVEHLTPPSDLRSPSSPPEATAASEPQAAVQKKEEGSTRRKRRRRRRRRRGDEGTGGATEDSPLPPAGS